MAREVKYDRRVGSIPITEQMRNDLDTISADTGKSLDELVRIGIAKVVKRYHQIKARREHRQKIMLRDGGART